MERNFSHFWLCLLTPSSSLDWSYVAFKIMSFYVVYPSVLDQSPCLSLLHHMYFKFSSFCLCHTSLQSFSLVLCQPAKISVFPSPEQPTRHLSRLAGSCFLLSFFPWWESVRKSMWIPSEAAISRPDPLRVPCSLMNRSFTRCGVSFGVSVCLLGPRVWLEL